MKLSLTYLVCGLYLVSQTPDVWVPVSQNGRSFASVAWGRAEGKGAGVTGHRLPFMSECRYVLSHRYPWHFWDGK